MFLLGISYAVASLSCALPVFLAVTGAASATPNFLSGVLTYVVYGLGMSMLLMVLTIALSVAKGAVVRRLGRILPHVGRLSGAILVLSGTYITVYWATNLGDPLGARGATSAASSGSRPGSPTRSGATPSCGRRCSARCSRPPARTSPGPDEAEPAATSTCQPRPGRGADLWPTTQLASAAVSVVDSADWAGILITRVTA
jgi:hypothetical protein